MNTTSNNNIKLGEVLGSSELQDLLTDFSNLDKHKRGLISLQDATKLIREQYKLPKWSSQVLQRVILTNENQLSFDEFLALLWEIEIEQGKYKGLVNYRIVEFLQLLDDYRKRCYANGQYTEAEKADLKTADIKYKYLQRQKQNFLREQQNKVQSVNNLQQNKLLEFNTAWNTYMEDYETAAIQSLEKLKAKHLSEMEEEENRIRNEYELKMKHSKLWHELKSKEKNLVKVKKYREAEKVKDYCRALELMYRKQKNLEIYARVYQRTESLRKHQYAILYAHLKRIEKDRNQQLKQRKEDSYKMMMKLRNMKQDIVQKQSVYIKEALNTLRYTMCLQSGVFKPRPKKVESLDRIKPDVESDSEDIMSKKKRVSFKIRINSFNRPKFADHSMYDP